MLWKVALCVPFCLAANLTDYRTLRIPNKLVVYTALAGLALQLLLNGPAGIGQWLAGMLPAFILLPFFALRMMGAGDIKLLPRWEACSVRSRLLSCCSPLCWLLE